MKRQLSRLALGAALVTTLVGIAGCSGEPTPTPTPTVTPTPTGDGELKIGTLFPSSGGVAFIGPAQVAGVNAALREINAAGGVNGKPVVVVNRDSGDATTQKVEESFEFDPIYYHLRAGGHVAALHSHRSNTHFARIDISRFFGPSSRSTFNSIGRPWQS